MDRKPLFSNKQIFIILIPLVIKNILSICIGMVDSIMVSSVGEAALAGVSLVTSLDVFLITLFSSFSTGGAVVLAQSMGGGDRKKSREASKQLIYITTIVSTIITISVIVFRNPLLHLLFGDTEATVMKNALDYFTIVVLSFPFLAISYSVGAILHAQGDTMTELKTSLFMNGLNIGGNAFFIYAMNMGAAGAALATLISRVIAAIIMIVIAHSKKRDIYIEKLFHYRPDKNTIKAIMQIGVPNGIENSLFQFGRLMTSSLISSLSTASIAANAASLSIANFQYTAGGAVQSTMVTVVGRCIGAKDEKQAKHYSKLLLGIGWILIFVVSGFICLFSSPLLSMFNLSDEALSTAKALLTYHSLVSMVIWVIAFCLPSAFRAATDVNFTMVVSILSMWIFRVALGYVMAWNEVSVFGIYNISGFGLGIMGVWIAMTIDWVFRTILFSWRYLSGRWLTKYRRKEKMKKAAKEESACEV